MSEAKHKLELWQQLINEINNGHSFEAIEIIEELRQNVRTSLEKAKKARRK